MSDPIPDRAALLQRPLAADPVVFWGHTDDGDEVGAAVLSQWYPAPFVVDGVRYATAEHWMMAGKARTFGDAATLARILADDDPASAKARGREVRGFDGDRWRAVARDIVVTGNLAKFGQHEALRRYLLGTGERLLVEASPHDAIWGIGLSRDDPRAADPARWRGENLLGFALMEVRARLRAP
jgi:ribA/ribD-fused uncharacterized protein